jgi:hypothetical protein
MRRHGGSLLPFARLNSRALTSLTMRLSVVISSRAAPAPLAAKDLDVVLSNRSVRGPSRHTDAAHNGLAFLTCTRHAIVATDSTAS